MLEYAIGRYLFVFKDTDEYVEKRNVKYVYANWKSFENNWLDVVKEFVNLKCRYIVYKEDRSLLLTALKSREIENELQWYDYVPCGLPKLKSNVYAAHLVYDIECHEDAETKELKWTFACWEFFNVDNVSVQSGISFSPEHFFHEIVLKCMHFLRTANIESNVNGKIRLCVMGFNSSRFDDLFLIPIVRKYVTQNQNDAIRKGYFYSEKNGAVIFSNFEECGVEMKFVDVLRYTGNLVSLRNIAKDLEVETMKGHFPLKLMMNDVDNLQMPIVHFLDEKGYFPPESFFNVKDYKEAYESWLANGGFDVPLSESLLTLAIKYCRDDVSATFQIWRKLEEMYFTYLHEYFQFEFNVLSDFHSAPSLMKAVALHSTNHKDGVWFYGETCEERSTDVWVPRGDAHVMWDKAIYGGWVGIFYRGVLVDKELSLVDIVSQYPNALTAPLPLGPGERIERENVQKILDRLGDYDLNTVPIFVVKVKTFPGEKRLTPMSTLPQRNEKTNEILWSYIDGYEGYYTSLDLWFAFTQEGWSFEALSHAYIHKTKGMIFNFFIQKLAQMKKEGKIEKNLTKTNVAKIASNSFIGKLGEHSVLAEINIAYNDDDVRNFLRECAYDDQVKLTKMIPQEDGKSVEFHYKKQHVQENRVPIQLGACMYAYSRMSRVMLAHACMPDREGARDLKECLDKDSGVPDVLYGDTDSIIASKRGIDFLKKNHPDFFSKEIKGYDPVTATLKFSIEEEIKNAKLGVFLNLKTYLLFEDERGDTKLRLKGHKLFRESSECPLHSNVIAQDCETCRCSVTDKHFHLCYHCLSSVWIYGFAGKIASRDIVIKSPVEAILPIHYFWALKGLETSVTYNRLNRTLSQPKGELNAYTVQNVCRNVRFKLVNMDHKYDTRYLPNFYPLGALP